MAFLKDSTRFFFIFSVTNLTVFFLGPSGINQDTFINSYKIYLFLDLQFSYEILGLAGPLPDLTFLFLGNPDY